MDVGTAGGGYGWVLLPAQRLSSHTHPPTHLPQRRGQDAGREALSTEQRESREPFHVSSEHPREQHFRHPPPADTCV